MWEPDIGVQMVLGAVVTCTFYAIYYLPGTEGRPCCAAHLRTHISSGTLGMWIIGRHWSRCEWIWVHGHLMEYIKVRPWFQILRYCLLSRQLLTLSFHGAFLSSQYILCTFKALIHLCFVTTVTLISRSRRIDCKNPSEMMRRWRSSWLIVSHLKGKIFLTQIS